MRPLLNPALSHAWRNPTTLQVGITPGRALVLGGLGPSELAVLRAMDGKNDLATLRLLATAAGGNEQAADRLVDLLFSAGAAIDHERCDEVAAPAAQYQPDQASLGLVDRSPDGGRAGFAKRGETRVDVVGTGRVGASVARSVAAGGIGTVHVDDHLQSDAPDFVVLAPTTGLKHTQLAENLVRAGVPHLLVQVVEVTGIVGPLVEPGASACLRCLDLHRTDRDRDWPSLRDQAANKPLTSPACDASLATAVAGLAAGQALAFLDGFDVATIGGTIELELPYGLPRRRSWGPHPDCGCRWP